MRLSCPNCGEQLSMNALIEHDAAREAIMLALQFPAPLGKLLLQYVSLFKPAQRALSMDRFAAILGELLPMIQDAKIERASRTWAAPQEYWKSAIDSMIAGRDKLTLPLKSHGYLLEIIMSYANKDEARKETNYEKRRKHGADAPVISLPKLLETKPKQPKSVMPADVRKTLQKFTGKESQDGTN